MHCVNSRVEVDSVMADGDGLSMPMIDIRALLERGSEEASEF